MESAPKDREIFLANRDYQEYRCKYNKGKWCYFGLDGFETMNWVPLYWTPTHWMDVPMGPSAYNG